MVRTAFFYYFRKSQPLYSALAIDVARIITIYARLPAASVEYSKALCQNKLWAYSGLFYSQLKKTLLLFSRLAKIWMQ